MITNFYSQITEKIVGKFSFLSKEDFIFKNVPKQESGDIALICFKMANKLNMTPEKAASHLAESIHQIPGIKTMQATGPYVNFFLDREHFANKLYKQVMTGDHFGSSCSGKGQKVLIEHTSINPNASPHVGRSRNALIGDALSRMLRYEGYEVDVHYYINDIGKQIALLVMECAGKDNLQFDEILSIYVEANKKAADDSEYEKKAFELLKNFEEHDPETEKEFKRVTNLCVKGQLEVLSRLNISYDFFDRESDFVHDHKVEAIEEQLHAKGSLFIDEHGRSVLDLKKLGFNKEEGRYFVLRRGNGSTMYGYRDIAYTIDKLSKSPDNNIIILGEDHKLYFQQLGLILKAARLTPPEAIHYSYIVLKDGKMSTRRGNVVLLDDFLDEAISRAKKRIDSACVHLSETERYAIAKAVGVGAVKFSILKVTPQKNVTFDWDSALTFEGDTGPYVQYSCVRITSILRKANKSVEDIQEDILLQTDLEWELVMKLASLEISLGSALEYRKPALLVEYVLDLARKFNEFYTNCPVLNAESPAVYSARLKLCSMTHQVLNIVLNLLGIEVPNHM